jgi:hypothetical protein
MTSPPCNSAIDARPMSGGAVAGAAGFRLAGLHRRPLCASLRGILLALAGSVSATAWAVEHEPAD